MPNGKVAFVIKLFPLHPGYVRERCAWVSLAQCRHWARRKHDRGNLNIVGGCRDFGDDC
jgi:hypothetical protein